MNFMAFETHPSSTPSGVLTSGNSIKTSTFRKKIVPAIAILIAIAILWDVIVTTNEEKLLASLNAPAESVSLHDHTILIDLLDDHFVFEYGDFLHLDKDNFTTNFEAFVKPEVNLKIELFESNITIDKDQATAKVTYKLYGPAAVYLNQGKVGKKVPAECNFTWIKQGKNWKITRIELLTIDGRNQHLPTIH